MPAEFDIPGLYISTAVKDVVHTMAGQELSEIKILSENDEAVLEEITGLLMMAGEFNILLSLGMSKASASTFVFCMTNTINPQLNDYELHDCVAELTNMIAGQIKTQLANIGKHFKNLPPVIVAGDRYNIIHKNKIEHKSKRFRAGSIDLVLKIFYYHS